MNESFECGETLESFQDGYRLVHGWLSMLVCVFGTFANAMNIVVLTRREMRSPTNSILTGLAVADMMVMLAYIPYVFHTFLFERPDVETYTYGWALFVMWVRHFLQVCHTISIWLTVMLAVWRYIAVAYPQKNREWCNSRRSLFTIGLAYLVCPIICIPIYLSATISPFERTINKTGYVVNTTGVTEYDPSWTNATVYFVRLTKERIHVNDMTFWVYSVVIKIIPCVALTVLSLRLIFALIEAKNRRQKLTSISINSAKLERSASCDYGKKKRKQGLKQLDKEKQTDRTTRMLIAVLLLFLCTEFPQGILGLLSVLLGDTFFDTCYQNLGTSTSFYFVLFGHFLTFFCLEKDILRS